MLQTDTQPIESSLWPLPTRLIPIIPSIVLHSTKRHVQRPFRRSSWSWTDCQRSPNAEMSSDESRPQVLQSPIQGSLYTLCFPVRPRTRVWSDELHPNRIRPVGQTGHPRAPRAISELSAWTPLNRAYNYRVFCAGHKPIHRLLPLLSFHWK